MSRSLNKIQLIGNAGGTPEIRTTASGARIVNLRVATNRTWRDAQGHEHEETEWHRLVFFGRLVDVVEAYVVKGDRLYIEGSLHYSQGKRDDGTSSYWTEIRVRDLIMLGTPRATVNAPQDNDEPDEASRAVDDGLPF